MVNQLQPNFAEIVLGWFPFRFISNDRICQLQRWLQHTAELSLAQEHFGHVF